MPIWKTRLETGADIDAIEGIGQTPLMRAIETIDLPMAKTLLRASPDLEIFNANGKTVAMMATQQGRPELVQVLIDAGADAEMAINIAVNSKAEKYAVCNALETLLVAESMADAVLPELGDRFSQLGVELRGCERTLKLMPAATAASDEDWATEYLGPILSVRVVQDLDVAMDHISRYGSQHTDCIVSNNYANTQRFLTEVDSASVLVNVSTQFADGFEYGLGAEIGISTDKIHARGPVGLVGMTSQKFIVLGQGEVRIR